MNCYQASGMWVHLRRTRGDRRDPGVLWARDVLGWKAAWTCISHRCPAAFSFQALPGLPAEISGTIPPSSMRVLQSCLLASPMSCPRTGEGVIGSRAPLLHDTDSLPGRRKPETSSVVVGYMNTLAPCRCDDLMVFSTPHSEGVRASSTCTGGG